MSLASIAILKIVSFVASTYNALATNRHISMRSSSTACPIT